jgi:hypothetical protein
MVSTVKAMLMKLGNYWIHGKSIQFVEDIQGSRLSLEANAI